MRLLIPRALHGMKRLSVLPLAPPAKALHTLHTKLCIRDLLPPYTPLHTQSPTKSQAHNKPAPMPLCPSRAAWVPAALSSWSSTHHALNGRISWERDNRDPQRIHKPSRKAGRVVYEAPGAAEVGAEGVGRAAHLGEKGPHHPTVSPRNQS